MNLYDSPKGNKKFKKLSRFFANTDFSLVAEVEGKCVGFLTIKNGLKLKSTYTGDIYIKITPDYLGLGIEKVLIRKLYRWLFGQADSIRRAKLKVRVDELMSLELLLNICRNLIRKEEIESEFFGAV